MTYEDLNKRNREEERRILRRNRWKAVPALKDNGSFQWKWIHPARKRAYSREKAVELAIRGERVTA